MNIEEILDALEDMLEEAWSIPLSGNKCVIDAEKVKQYLEDIRLNMPTEIKQAKLIVNDRSDIISQAEKHQKLPSAKQKSAQKLWLLRRKWFVRHRRKPKRSSLRHRMWQKS